MYFVSDMPGGFGGFDIYKASCENGDWGIPENLGASINSSGDEIFPYIFEDSILFFSSNGRGGLGEHDIFRVNLLDDRSLRNMGVPFNLHSTTLGLSQKKKGSLVFLHPIE
ncbi:MAG: hypothetical protein HC905_00690 [Bacteroidales bacterium]|nr:hypothetical protein [Bacteroidales bacterium]